MQKARRQFTKNLRPLVSARFQVLFHPLIQGTFHLSLTVLVHYRSLSRIQPCRMVPADSNGISPVPSYSGYHYLNKTYQYWAFTIYGLIFQKNSCSFYIRYCGPTTPNMPKHIRFRLFPFRSPLLRKSLLFSLPLVTQMFQFTRFAIQINLNHLIFNQIGCPIRKSTDQIVCANPRSLSQLITSFIASESQGIPPALLHTSFKDLNK